jgi:predicted O-methyltransferase YrrM
LSGIADGSLDFVYIDGDHRFDAVLMDLEISMQKLRPGGHIALDDYMMKNWWKDGVVRALNVFLGAHSDQIMIDRCLQRQVLLRKRDDKDSGSDTR